MLASGIVKEQSPKSLITAREKLYELLINCIPAQVILKTLVMELLPKLDDSVKGQVSRGIFSIIVQMILSLHLLYCYPKTNATCRYLS